MFAFEALDGLRPRRVQPVGMRAFVLRGFALPYVPSLLPCIEAVGAAAPFRQMVTPGGFAMSVALTNCGARGWTTDRRGYRYTATDPDTGQPWPAMPGVFEHLARKAAEASGFADFVPDACLMNRYEPGSRLALHQDKNEQDFDAPIVSVSLGMTARFLFGGLQRTVSPEKITLHHGDVVVWGGEDRLRFHGVMPLKGDAHPLLGSQRINFTFRKAGQECTHENDIERTGLSPRHDAVDQRPAGPNPRAGFRRTRSAPASQPA